jgi:hypothetical protein
MIKYIYFSLLLIAGLMLTACSSDDNSVEQAPKIYYMTVDATKGVNEAASPAYRRALNLSGSTLSASWATTEHVYVQGTLVSNSTLFWFEGSILPQTAGTTTRLNGAISLPAGWQYSSIDEAIGTPYRVNLQFPRSGVLDYTGQIGTLADIAAKYDYAIATNVQFDIENDHIVGTNSATFFNQQAIVKFTLIDKADGTTKLNPTALTIQFGEESISLTSIPAETYSTNDSGVLYVAIPGFDEKAVNLTATCSSGTYNYTKSNVTFTNGKYYEITVKMTKQQ